MPSLPPFVAKLIASDGYEEKKYFETKAESRPKKTTKVIARMHSSH